MRDFFDYAYYRINKVYLRWDGESGITSIIGVSMIQILWPVCFILFLSKILMPPLSLAPHSRTLGYITVIILSVTVFLNYRLYNGKFNLFKSKWDTEPMATRRLKGALIVLLMVLPWLLLFIIGKINNKP
jgi:hypothetical protein